MRTVIAPLLATFLAAQEPELVSGPAAGAALPKAMVYAPSGPHAGQELDARTTLGDGPGVLLFIHEVTRETAPVIGGLDRLALEFAPLGFHALAIRLAADRSQAET